MRPWLALKHTGAAFEERLIALYQEEGRTRAQILPHSPSGRVPALKVGNIVIPESLAICEYLAEAFPAARLWPEDADLRALGRAAASEMHAGFRALRLECPMDLARPVGAIELSDDAKANIARVRALWTDLLGRSGGEVQLFEFEVHCRCAFVSESMKGSLGQCIGQRATGLSMVNPSCRATTTTRSASPRSRWSRAARSPISTRTPDA